MAEQTSVKTLLLQLKGEVSESVDQAINKTINTVDVLTFALAESEKTTEKMNATYTEFIRQASEGGARVSESGKQQAATFAELKKAVDALAESEDKAFQVSVGKQRDRQESFERMVRIAERIREAKEPLEEFRTSMAQTQAFMINLAKTGATPLIQELGKLGETASGPVQDALKELLISIGKLSTDPATGMLTKSLVEVDEAALKLIQTTPELTETWEKYGNRLQGLAAGHADLYKETTRLDRAITSLKDILSSGKIKVAAFAGSLGLVVLGLKKVRDAVRTTLDRLENLFTTMADTIKNTVIGAFDTITTAMKDFAEEGVRMNSILEQTQLQFLAAAKDEGGAAEAFEFLRQEARRTGQALEEFVPQAARLIPFAQGDIEKFKEIVRLAERLAVARPELPFHVANRAMQQFLAGNTQTIGRTFGLSQQFLKDLTDEYGFTTEALDILLDKMNITDELVEAQGQTWKGLITVIKDYGSQAIATFTGPIFERIRNGLRTLVNNLNENSGQIDAFAGKLGEDLGGAFDRITKEIFGPQGFSEDKLFDIAEWGTNLIASLVNGILHGINTVLIPTLIQVTQVIADYLRGASPPRLGLLSTIDKWFGPIIRAYLQGFDASDFTVLNDIGRIIKASLETAFAAGEISKDDLNARLLEARELTVRLVQEFKNLGTVATSTLNQIGNLVGMDVQLIEAYIELTQRLEDAQRKLAAAQEAFAKAQAKVRAIQEEIRKFELETAEIPERYTRGRRRELENRLVLAQEEARIRQESVKAAQAQVREAQNLMRAFMQMISQLERFAKDAADALKDDNLTDIGAKMEGDIPVIEEIEGAFLHLYESIKLAFSEAATEMEFLINFLKTLAGIDLPTGREMMASVELAPGVEEGLALRAGIGTIVDNIYKVRDAIGGVVDKLLEIRDWYNDLPEPVKEWFRTGAKLLAINLVTGGLVSGGILAILGGTGILSVVGGQVLLPIAVVFTLVTALGDLIFGALQEAGFNVGKPSEAARELILAIKLRIANGEDFIEAIGKIADEIIENVPFFKFLDETLAGTPEDIIPTVDISPGLKMSEDVAEEKQGVLDAVNDIIKGVTDFFSGGADDMSTAATEGLVDPIVGAAEELDEELIGKSIFPDMIDAIMKLFTDLPNRLVVPLQRMVDTIRMWSTSAAEWWRMNIIMMRDDVELFIHSVNSAISAIQRFNTVSSGGTTGSSGGRLGGDEEFQTGGINRKLQRALLHPGELILNIGQQKNVALALAGAGGVSGPGPVEININQTFEGVVPESAGQIKRLAKEGAYEAITEVVNKAGQDRKIF